MAATVEPMTMNARAALDELVAALQAHFAAAQQRSGEQDPLVVQTYRRLADAFDTYDEALYDAFAEVTPLILYDDVEDLRDDQDDDLDDDDDDDDEDEDDELDGDVDDLDDDDMDDDDLDEDDLDDDEDDDLPEVEDDLGLQDGPAAGQPSGWARQSETSSSA
jgi:hypothetical protein